MSATLPFEISLQIVLRPSIKLIGTRIHTDRQTARDDIKRLQNDIRPHINELVSEKDSPSTYGVSWVIDAQARKLNYCAAISLNEGKRIPDQFEEIVIPAGLYAEFSLPSYDDLHHFYDFLHQKWLKEQNSGIETGDTPYYEVYPHGYQKQEPIKLYIPVVST